MILFIVIASTWVLYSMYLLSAQPPSPAYPDIGGAATLAIFTLSCGICAFLLAALGVRSSEVPKGWAWMGLILNAPIMLYVLGYYSVTFVSGLIATQ